MLTQEEISDRIEIAEVLQRYFRSMDTWDYDLLETVFTPDARLRYDALEGTETTYRKMIAGFREFNRYFSFMQHMSGQLLIELDGDTARSNHNLRAIHVQTTHQGEENEWIIYGVYWDLHVRTEPGWRISERHFRSLRTVGRLLPFDQVRSYPEPPWL
jgi:hypothetical protein